MSIRISLAVFATVLSAQPPNLAKLVAATETAAMEARNNYAYRQTVLIEEMGKNGMVAGKYQEEREVIFSKTGERTEQMRGKPWSALARLRLTEEDFRDIREVQPFLFTNDNLWLYETKFRGDEVADGVDCWLLEVRPRQTLQGMRLFEGMLWIEKAGYGVVKSTGRAVPQILSRKQENLFPAFTTFREKVDGAHWFPIHTHSDDVLHFTSGSIRQRMTIKYEQYQRFGAESTVTFDKPLVP
ncbi:MAG: hypothetical protein R2729_32010 [Bryobacteraceae bacterium]